MEDVALATFQERLKELRKAQNMKQSELAERLGVSMYTVSVWERGQRRPEYDNLDSLCEIFQVNLGYLLGTSDDPTPPGAPSNEDIARWSEEDEVESLEHIFRIMTRLNQTSKRIISAAILQAYKEDKRNGTLEAGYSVTVNSLLTSEEKSKDNES